MNISLILFLLGLFFFLALAGQIVLEYALQELELKVILAGETSIEKGKQLRQEVLKSPFALSCTYVSKEEAIERFKDIGDDFLEAMDGTNPLPATLYLKIKPEYVEPDSVKNITKYLLTFSDVADIYYPITLIEQLSQNIQQIRMIALGLGSVMIIIAFLLILNTLRMAIHARRLVIRSMQLVGATNAYIRQPFIRMGIFQGLLAGTLAGVSLHVLFIALNQLITVIDLSLILHNSQIWVLYFSLILLGTVVGWLSSRVAVNRYLNKQLDQII